MKVLKATQEQAEKLNGTYLNGSKIQFEKDANNNYVLDKNVLIDDDFIEIRDTLLNLPLIDYKPINLNGK
jgi:hypothetical protein